MHFVRTEDLKTGMRLARPVYNKKSILLFDRNSLLSLQAIESIRNFGLIGVYVLEPAEPLPPLTQEDLEFERFQIQAVSAIEEEQDRILKTRKQNLPSPSQIWSSAITDTWMRKSISTRI